MNFKFSPNLFLEVIELQKFKESLDSFGFRKVLLESSESFGLVKNYEKDSNFTNGKVSRDLDDSFGNKTIKIQPLYGIDKFGQFIYQDLREGIPIPNDGNWYWVKVKHQLSSIEKGKYSISSDGNLVGDGSGDLTKIFRGQPNFPTRIKFSNSVGNLGEYDVLEVIDAQNAIIQHPALNTLGASAFIPETDLTFGIIGTFTPGVAIPGGDKYPFEYDSCLLSLVQEDPLFNNVKPTILEDEEFFLARVQVQGSDLVVQDKRINYWEEKGAQRVLDIERQANPLVGVESIKWNHIYTSADRNIVEVAWGMRSDNWSVDSSLNKLTLSGGSKGGKFKTVDDFTNGDFNGWRVYTQNGRYSRVISSIKQGSAINLILDVLDVDNYSTDGGLNFLSAIGEFVVVVPDCDLVEFKFTPGDTDSQPFMEKHFEFPVNELFGKCEVPLFKLNTCLYNVQYRYKSYKEFTDFKVIPTDDVNGYYTERSFNESNGLFKDPIDRILYPYTASLTEGFIQLEVAPHSLALFKTKVDKGDIIGVQTHTSLSSTLYELTVGISKNYQYISGTITLPGDDIYFNLKKTTSVGLLTYTAVEGNEFRIHFECSDIVLAGKTIIIAQEGLTPGSVIALKTITQRDVWKMKNQDGGIVFDCVFDGTNWQCYQNYDSETKNEIITLDGVIGDMFDGTGLGNVKGYFGLAICNGNNTTHDLRDRFIVGAGSTYAVGNIGGANTVALTVSQLPDHSHRIPGGDGGTGSSWVGFPDQGDSNPAHNKTQGLYTAGGGAQVTGGEAHENRPPYYALIYAKRL